MEKLVVFDLDGTLIHSLPDIVDNVNLTLRTFGYKERSENEIMRLIGNGAKNLIKNALPVEVTEEELNERLAFYNDKYTNCGSTKTRVFDGIGEVVKTLKRKGYKTAILTNKPQPTTDAVYERYLSGYAFDKVVGNTDNRKRKPDPTELFKIMQEFNCKPENTYFVGDGETDVMTAINAKVNGISALWGYRTKDELKAVGAKIFADRPEDLLIYIK